jgi:REP element-mobilizing transposase RayT
MDACNKPIRGHASLRRGRHSEAGRIYLVTFTTDHRESLFEDWIAASSVAAATLNPLIWRASRLLCWVLMPDHWHGLIELGGMDELRAVVNRLKGTTSRSVNIRLGRQGHVWAKGYHDHALRTDEDLLATARYIISNPVRAGLVKRVGTYPFWNAVWLDPCGT